ncbi:hypothetical protein K523DRAFT_320747 [Schizophyllum commune Tattone D]|nr:hypothetical protein K523DRAFT_320747 [Schizophyllum commune Tattone D]
MLREASIHAPHPHLLTSKNTAHSLYTLFAAFSLDSTGGQVIDAWVTSSLKPLMEKVACILYTHDGWKAQADPEVGALLLALMQRAAPCALPASSAPLADSVEAMPEAPIMPAPVLAPPSIGNPPAPCATDPVSETAPPPPPTSSTASSASTPPAPPPPAPAAPALVAPKSEYRHKRKAVQYPESSESHKKAKQASGAPDVKPTAGASTLKPTVDASDLKPTAGTSDLKPTAGAPDVKPMAGAPGPKISSGPYTTRIPGVLGAKRTAGTLDVNRGAGGKRMPDAPRMKHNVSGVLQGKEDTPPVAGSSSTASNPLTKPSKSKSMNLPSKLKPWRW